MVALNFRQGLVRFQTSGPPNFIQTFLQKSSDGTHINLIVSPDPTVFTIAQKDQDYLFVENQSVTNAWGPFQVNLAQSYWLYWDVNFVTGVLTRGFTSVAPIFSPTPPLDPVIDQHWFDTSGPEQGGGSTFQMYVWNGAVWIPRLRVFAAQYQSSSNIIAYPTGSQIGVTFGTNTVNAGYLIFDDANLPVQRFSRDRTGVFIHTAMPLAAQWSKLANFSIESALLQATASENIPQFYAVAYTGPDNIGLARNTDPTKPAIGLASENMYTGETRTYMVQGFIENSQWNWDVHNTQPAGTPLFVDTTGALTATPPQSGSIQRVATIVDAVTIFVSVEELIAYQNSPSSNLVTVQLDKTTGNTVVTAIQNNQAPSGTGYVHVTSGVQDVSARSGAQVTADLSLFTSVAKGVVPASGGGTSNFLRADGSWSSPLASSGVTSFNGRVGNVTLSSTDVTTALGFSPGHGSVVSVSATGSTGLTITGSPITTSGTLNISLNAELQGLSSLGFVGIVKRAGVGSYSAATGSDIDAAIGYTPYNASNPSGYISTNQNINVTGDVSGSGTTNITLSLATVVAPGTYKSVTVNGKGLVTAGTNPTTLSGFGITDALSIHGGTMSGNIVMSGGATITGVPNPTGATDGANKQYVDAAIVGLSWKQAALAATTGNITLSGLQTIDGYSAQSGDRILVNAQTTASENGIYVAAVGVWSRASDSNTAPSLNGASLLVEKGTSFSNTQWVQIATVTTLGTDPVTFVQFSSSGGAVSSVGIAGLNGIGVSGSPIISAGIISISLGNITPTSVVASGMVTGSNLSGTNTGDQTITLTGDVSGTGTGTFSTSLATVNSNVGSFTGANITVDGKGRITAAASGSIALHDGSTTPIYTVTGSPVSGTGTLTFTLASQNPGTVFAGPATGPSGQPTFRALTAADIPTNGVERVVWRYAAGGASAFASSTPTSTTSGVSVSNVTTGTCSADYSFTGYDHPPVTITTYGQQTNTPTSGSCQWSVTTQAAPFVMSDTGSNTAPNLLSSFTSSNTIKGYQTDGSSTNATDGAGTGAYLIIEFKF